jgi:hypothetical protein
MSLFNPTLAARVPRRQAASLAQTIEWNARRLWAAMERVGQRRAAPELLALARRLQAERHDLAQELVETARQWSALGKGDLPPVPSRAAQTPNLDSPNR